MGSPQRLSDAGQVRTGRKMGRGVPNMAQNCPCGSLASQGSRWPGLPGGHTPADVSISAESRQACSPRLDSQQVPSAPHRCPCHSPTGDTPSPALQAPASLAAKWGQMPPVAHVPRPQEQAGVRRHAGTGACSRPALGCSRRALPQNPGMPSTLPGASSIPTMGSHHHFWGETTENPQRNREQHRNSPASPNLLEFPFRLITPAH